jgi:hypothetical protein
VLKEQGILSEIAMLTSPNHPVTKNNRIVWIFLGLIMVTYTSNVLLTLNNQMDISLILVSVVIVLDFIAFVKTHYSTDIYIERN